MKEFAAQQQLVKEAEHQKEVATKSLRKIEEATDMSKRASNEADIKLHEIELKKISQEKDVLGESAEIKKKANELSELKTQNLEKEAALNRENLELAKLTKAKLEEQKSLTDASLKLTNTKNELNIAQRQLENQ